MYNYKVNTGVEKNIDETSNNECSFVSSVRLIDQEEFFLSYSFDSRIYYDSG